MAEDLLDNSEAETNTGEQLVFGGLLLGEDALEPQSLPDMETIFSAQPPQSPAGEAPGRRPARKPSDEAALAPMLRQYLQIKRDYPEHLLLFQVGDFYEIFFDDARTASAHLGIRLTSRDKESPSPVPMCGVPIRALENYLPRLLRGGFSCVIVSQAEEARDKKGMVRREITRIVTPGIRYEGDGLDEKQFNYLAALCFSGGQSGALSFADVSTGRLRVQEMDNVEEMAEALTRVRPAELLLPAVFLSAPVEKTAPWMREARRLSQELGCRVVYRPFNRVLKPDLLRILVPLLPDTAVSAEDAQGIVSRLSPTALSVLGAMMGYVEEVSFGSVPRFSHFAAVEPTQSVFLDAATRRNLEITETRLEGDRRNSLLYHVDYTRTPMGSRLLTDWLLSPSGNREELEARYDSVAELCGRPGELENIRTLLCGVRDIDRLLSRVTGLRAVPRDLNGLQESLSVLPELKALLRGCRAPLLSRTGEALDDLSDVEEKLRVSLAAEAPLRVNEGGIFRDGFHAEVDRLRGIRTNGHLWLADLEERERKRTGISGLKVRYNNVFGYFIEITKAHLHKVPDDFERRQTLVNAERFITKELKDYELTMLSAKAKLFDLERELFVELRSWVAAQAARIQCAAQAISIIDVFSSFAHTAASRNYCRPVLASDGCLEIREGRHPVVECVIGAHNFISNDVRLDRSERRFAVLTGPNMGGKSTYLRQIGLIQLLAQAGSFVPAKSANLLLVDRIFTRIGAADDLTRGDSTFMVEMKEAAAIVRKATSRSLVLIDEVGRGTATLDGLALATAISEWLLQEVGCCTVFATHFHELTNLPASSPGAFCLSVGVLEKQNEIIFTHRIEERAADRSYGIEVARLAGLPESLLVRAQLLLQMLEHEARTGKEDPVPRPEILPFGAEKEAGAARELRDRLLALSPNSMTPLQALQEIIELKNLAER